MKNDVVAVLCDIRSIHNVGSMFRTADGAGISKLYLCGITPTPLDRFRNYKPDFEKVALGAEKTMAWEHAVSAMRILKKLKKEGYEIVALEQAPNSVPHAMYHAKGNKIACVVGNEVKGLPRAILTCADAVVEIPMRGSKESLNVSVAFGIIAYALVQ